VAAGIGPPAPGFAARLLSGVHSLRSSGERMASLVPALVAAPGLDGDRARTRAVTARAAPVPLARSAYNPRVPGATHRVASYARELAPLVSTPGVNEPTYYPALQSLLAGLLRDRALPFQVRVGTSQYRPTGGADMPDLALYDGAGEFPVVLGEVKLPAAELEDMAVSTERDDQIGRYLRRTGVVLLTNVRGFALLVGGDARSEGPVPPQERRVLDTVELWPSSSALKKGAAIAPDAAEALAGLLERAVTEFAAIAEPESLARILARQARRAKQDLPKQFSQAVRPLLDDFGKALGIHFEGEDGDARSRSHSGTSSTWAPDGP